MTDTIEQLYAELLEYNLTYTEMYDMTVAELIATLVARRKGLGYQMWRTAILIGWATMGKDYPDEPQKAVPELFPKPKTYEMPDVLKELWLREKGVRNE